MDSFLGHKYKVMKNNILKKLFKTLYVTGLVLSISAVPCAAAVDISIGGADIGAPKTIFDMYAPLKDPDVIEPVGEMSLSGAIKNNIYIGDLNLSGLTYNQAIKTVDDYVTELSGREFTFVSVNNNSETVNARELGIYWANKDAIKDAISIGKSGNLICQYKAVCDLQHEKKVYPLQLGFEKESVLNVINKQGYLYNQDASDALITRENGVFHMTPGESGIQVDVDGSVAEVMDELNKWNGEEKTFQLKVKEKAPKATEETLALLTDVLGTFTTGFKSSSADRSGNVRTGCKHLNGHLLMPGEQLSVYEAVSPFTEENGYFMAGSYLNGQVVESLGGGICQVSSTLYNAVIRAELQVDERYPHSMVVNYVDLSSDAAIAGTYKDFKFTNSTDYPIFIEGFTTEDKHITFNIYGHETRPANRTIEFESVQTSKTEPDTENIIADGSKPIGYISTQSAHIGYTGELWKVVKVDGVETDRIKINKSTYHPSPRSATVGTAAGDPSLTAAMQAAIGSGSIDYVKQTIASLTAAAKAAGEGE